tara:strand:+ start:4619 stop:4942 length:324 start_codon:yes stop_codon:yes gene_type:complete
MLDPKLFKEEVQETRKKEQEKKLNHIGSLNPHKGHTLYSINKKTFVIKKAEFEKLDAGFGSKKQNRKVIVEEDCIYRSKLNMKSLLKWIEKEYPQQYYHILEINSKK